MDWIRTLIPTVMLLIRYGPRLLKLAKEVHDVIEDHSHRKENDPSYEAFDGAKEESVSKANRFDRLFMAEAGLLHNKILLDDNVEEIRETIVKIRNRGKTGRIIRA